MSILPATLPDIRIDLMAFSRPAGFVSQDLLDVTRQYWKDSYNSIRWVSLSLMGCRGLI